MNIINRTVIKEYEYAQVNLITDYNGNKFIEKIQFHIPPVMQLDFEYNPIGLEIFESILKPLEIPHPRIIYSNQNEKCTTIIMEYIDGRNCEDEPKAKYLYLAAEKLGTIYNKSKMNMNRLDKSIIEKYSLTKEKILDYIKIINTNFHLPPMDSLIDYIFEKYQDRTVFVNHYDIQFKNFIYNDDLHLIDWDNVKIQPFFSDLPSLIGEAYKVGADINEIKKRYLQFAQISSISDEDIKIGSLIGVILGVFSLLIFDCPLEWIEGSYNELQDLVLSFDFH